MNSLHPRGSFRFQATVASFALLASTALLTSPAVRAASIYYDGGAKTWVAASFSTDATGATDPAAAPGGTDDIFFNVTSANATANTLTLTAAQAANSLTFNTTGASAIGTAGFALTINGGITMNAGAGLVNLISPLVIGGAQSWTNGSANTLTVTNSANTGAIAFNNLLTLNGGAFQFVLSNTSTTTGAGGVKITGGSVVTNASTVNPFGTGTLELNSGTLKNSTTATARSVSNAVSITGDFTFDAGGATGNNAFTAAATTTGARILTVNTSTTSFASTLALGGNLTAQGSGTLLLSGIVSDGGSAYSVTKSGAGALTLAVGNTFTGGVTLNAGTLNIGGATALGTGTFAINGGTLNTNGASVALTTNNVLNIAGDFANTGSNSLSLGSGATTLVGGTRTITTNGATTQFTIGGSIGDGGNNYGLTKAGVGTLVLSGANSTYGGTTTVSAGTLQATLTGALPGFATAGRVAVSNGATLTVNVGSTAGLFTAANLDSLRTAATFATGARLGIDTTGIAGGFTYGSAIGDPTGGTLGLVKAGTNTLTLNNTANSYSGGTFINAGTLNFNALSTLGTGAITFNGGTLQYATGNTADISARTVTLTGAGTVDTNGSNVTFANPIGNAGTGGFTKAGAGTLTLSAANTFTGSTNAGGGILSVSNNNQLGSGTANIAFSGGGTFTNAGTLLITGTTFTTSRAFTYPSTGFVIDVAPGGVGTFTNTGNNGNGSSTAIGLTFGSSPATANSPGGTLNFAGSLNTYQNNNGTSNGGPTIGVRFRNLTANVTGAFTLSSTATGSGNANAGNITVGPGAGETTIVNLNGTGQFYLGGTANNTSNNLAVGGSPGGATTDGSTNTGGTTALPSTATLNINSTNALAVLAPNLYVAHNGTTTATMNQNAGGVTLSNTLTLGYLGTAASGTYNLGNGSASTASLTTPTIIKGAGTGVFNFNGGTLNPTSTSSSTAFLGTGATAVSATVDAGGARINTSTFTVGIAQGLLHASALGATADGGLTKTGTGTLTLGGASTYTGPTSVSAGTLALGSAGSLANTSSINVAANFDVSAVAGGFNLNSGTLLGTGTVAGAVKVNSGATIQGGSGVAAGALTLTTLNGLTLGDGSIIQLALGAPGTPGTHSTLATNGATFAANQKFTFIDLGATAGTYNDIITGLTADPGSEMNWMLTNSGFTGSFVYDAGTIDLTLGVTAVPEPATCLGGLLLVGYAGWRRRRSLWGLFARV